MDRDKLFEAIQKRYKNKIRRVNRKDYRIFFKKFDYALEVGNVLFDKDIPHIHSGNIIRLN